MESKELHVKIDKILRHIESLDNQMPWLIRSQAKELEPMLMKMLARRRSAAKVFLQVDGANNATQIGTVVRMKQPNVSTELKFLEDSGLIEKTAKHGVYKKTKINDILKLDKKLEKRCGFK